MPLTGNKLIMNIILNIDVFMNWLFTSKDKVF